ncbi:MAG: SusC/RagA family TonB-linked outer membrane protein [Algicola sp.]|nr:SusC/RagA family TonB-linked outer membrane protein [Algicola sp.]
MKLKLTWLMTLFMAFVMQFSFAQEKTITGTVTSAGDGLPLPGVSVIVKGTSRGVQTDFDGIYSIKANTGETLVFSYVGTKTVEKVVGSASKIDVSLAEDLTALEEVVIEAYSNNAISREKSTSAITTLTAESVESRPNASVVTALQGQVSGLNIGTGSGQPGANSTIILRGVGSINGNIEPLFIVDGVPVDEDNFRSINQNDIASISVLKDASASSLYGSRGANGAIVVTTKRGKFGTATEVNYRSQFGYSILPEANFEVMNTRQKLLLDRQQGEGLGNGLSDAAIAVIANSVDTDWSDIFFRQGTTVNHNISISSGAANSSTFSSIGYFEQNGVTLRSNLKRFSFRNNYTAKSENEKFNFGSNVTMNYSESNFIQNEATGNLSNPFIVPYVAKPYFSPYNPDGSINIIGFNEDSFDNTPYTSLNNTELNTNKTEEIKIIASVNGSYELLKNVTAGIRFGLDYTQQNGTFIEDPESIYGSTAVTPAGPNAADFQGQHFESLSRDARFNNVVSLNYNNIFADKHTIDLSLFTEYSKSYLLSNSLNAFGLDPKLDGFGTAFIGGTTFEDLNDNGEIDGANEFPYIPTVSVGRAVVGLFSYFGVAKYDYDERYGLQASVRRDASSRFSSSNRWATFYSVSGRWNIHNEAFMEDSVFNSLKLRVSYGTSGNDRITGGYYGARFNTYNTYALGTGYNNTPAYFASQIANETLKWETTTQTNIGLDFALWDYKLSGTIDVYSKDTDDLFQSQPVSALNGITTLAANIGSMNNKGVELSLNWKAISNEDFNLSFFANGSYNKNEVTKLPNGEDVPGVRLSLSEGQPIGSFFAVRWAGVNPANGNPLYLDIDGNITETYTEDNRVFIDKAIYPTFQGGFGFNSSYKGFSLDTQFSFVADIYRYNGSLGVIEDPTLTGLANSSVTLATAWQQPGDVTAIPSLNTPSTRNLLTDRYIEDASFLRLRNVSLGYSFDDVLKEGSFISSLKLYVQAENLITFSKWRGWDPESNYRASDFFDYPTVKIVTLGLDVKF